MKQVWAEVSKSALAHNVKQFRKKLNGTKLMAVVKSNAYGHGLIETSKIFVKSGADWLGVNHIDEAIDLRRGGIKAPILVLSNIPKDRVKDAIKNDIRFFVYDIKSIQKKWHKKPKVHLKIDTGMSRQGIFTDEVVDFVKKASKYARVEGIATHFANADNLEDRRYFEKQLKRFKDVLKVLDKENIDIPIKHAFNTPAYLTSKEDYFDMVRVGIGLYGLWPSYEFMKKMNKLKIRPALKWKTKIVQIKKIKKNTPVGYGTTEKVKRDSTIALLPIGYFDGYDRKNSSIGEISVNGKKAKVLGRVSMNLTVIDITGIKAKVGDEVGLIDEKINAESIAHKLGTISYEVVCRINPWIERIYK